MRLALLSDVHGNAVALNAVLAALEAEAVDQIVFLGDAALLGPEPGACIQRLQALGGPAIRGNTDSWLLRAGPEPVETEEDQRRLDLMLWNAAVLSPADQAWLRGLAATATLDMPGGQRLLACHGSPQSEVEGIRATTPGADLERMVAGEAIALLASGHTHQALAFRWRTLRLVNPGSVGLPTFTADDLRRYTPWAEYALLTASEAGMSLDFRRVRFDFDALVRAARASGMPHPDWWLSHWVPV